MVGVFRRSLSFPNKIVSTSPNTSNRSGTCSPSSNSNSSKPRPALSHHTRSISLPCRSHPVISQLKHYATALQSWALHIHPTATSAWLCDGLTSLKDFHHCLHEILQLPQTQESLRRHPHWVDNLLEQFLHFVDVYGIFRTSLLALKEEHSAVQVAMRKRDESKIALYVKARNKMAKEMAVLVNALGCITRPSAASSVFVDYVNVGDVQLAAVITDVVQVTVTVSLALFNRIALSFRPTNSKTWIPGLMLKIKIKAVNKAKVVEDQLANNIQQFEQLEVPTLWGFRKKGDEEVKMTMKKMQEFETSIARIETCTETVFRSLINARVSLLNTLAQ